MAEGKHGKGKHAAKGSGLFGRKKPAPQPSETNVLAQPTAQTADAVPEAAASPSEPSAESSALPKAPAAAAPAASSAAAPAAADAAPLETAASEPSAPAAADASPSAPSAPEASVPQDDLAPLRENLTEKQAAQPQGEWSLGPKRSPVLRALKYITGTLAAAAVVALAVLVWPQSQSAPAVTAIASATPVPRATKVPDMEEALLAVMPESAEDTDTAEWDAKIDAMFAQFDELDEQTRKELEEAAKTDTNEVLYDSAADYFGSEDASLVIVYSTAAPTTAPTAKPTATPVPTKAPTCTPVPATATPEPTEAPTCTPAEGEDPNDTTIVRPTITPAPVTPSPEPTEAPTCTPEPAAQATATAIPAPSELVLTGSGSASCVTAYNSWSQELKEYTYATAKGYGVSYEMVLAIIYHESRFNASATHLNANGTTDWGLMQVNDVCLPLLQRSLGISSMSELLEPKTAIQAGCAILAYHLRYTSSEEDALLRYQVGAGNYKIYKEAGVYPACYTETINLRTKYLAAGI